MLSRVPIRPRALGAHMNLTVDLPERQRQRRSKITSFLDMEMGVCTVPVRDHGRGNPEHGRLIAQCLARTAAIWP